IWCDTPPDIFIPKGYLVVSRDKAALRCQEGYKTGENTRLVCDKNKWSGPILKCEEILCDSVVGNESFSAGGEWQMTERVNKFSFGTKRKLRCDPGYEMTGQPDTVTCLKNGTWSKTTARCIEKKQDDKKSLKIIAIAVGTVLVVLIFCLLGLTLYCVQRNRSKEVVVVYKPGESGQSQRESEDNYNSTTYYDVIDDRPPKVPVFPGTLSKGYSTPVDSRFGTNKMPADIAFGTLKTSTLYSS
ncbi:sushi domain-containing protein 1-like, partial [Stegodyphus dumicola]|uniref:sushi domain-containing protein 1-like n=1 Tax=Stegodyphus dumicola TaxID=202533 RepID=UPI0015A7D2D3